MNLVHDAVQNLICLVIGLAALLAYLKALPHRNPDAAWNLQMNLLDLIQRLEREIQELKDAQEAKRRGKKTGE